MQARRGVGPGRAGGGLGASTGLFRSKCARPARKASRGGSGAKGEGTPGLRKGGKGVTNGKICSAGKSVGRDEGDWGLIWELFCCVNVCVCVNARMGSGGKQRAGVGVDSSAGARGLLSDARAGAGERAGAKPASDARRAAPQKTPPPAPPYFCASMNSLSILEKNGISLCPFAGIDVVLTLTQCHRFAGPKIKEQVKNTRLCKRDSTAEFLMLSAHTSAVF